MASPQTAYLSVDELKSSKSGHSPSALVVRILASRLPANLSWTLVSLVNASRQGPDLWASTFASSVEAGGTEARHGYRTVQRHIDRLERLKVLKKKYDANTFVPGYGMRRTATYVLHEEAGKFLSPRERYSDWQQRNRRSAPARFRPQRVSHSHNSSMAQEPLPAAIALTPSAPAPARANDGQRKFRQLTSREGRDLVARLALLMKGCKSRVSPADGFAIDIQPGEPGYRAPMSQENALTSACMAMGIPFESAVNHLKLCRWKLGEEEPGS